MQEREFVDLMSDLTLFVSVARAGSLTRASNSLAVPMSTISRRLLNLEKAMGVRLIERSTRRFQLTDAGIDCLARCDGLVDAARDAVERVRESSSGISGPIRVSMTPDFALYYAIEALCDFAVDNAQIDFQLDLNPRTIDLIMDRYDVALHVGELPDSSYTLRRIARLPNILCASPTFLTEHGEPKVPADLERTPCVSLPHHRGRWHLNRGGRMEVVEVRGRFVANNLSVVRKIALRNMGIVSLGSRMVEQDLVEGSLVHVLPDWELEPAIIHAVTASRMLTPKVRRFIDYMAAVLQDSSLNT